MRILWKACLGAVALSLVLVAVVLAHSGVTGRLWDSGDPALPWQHGAQVAAVECDAAGVIGDQIYGCDVAETTPGIYGEFSFDWGYDGCDDVTLNDTHGGAGPTSPPDTGYVCLYVIWEHGGSGQPEDLVTAPKQNIPNITSRISFDNVQAGTGPNAITLANVTARSANLWLPVGLAALSVLAVGALIITRRLRS